MALSDIGEGTAACRVVKVLVIPLSITYVNHYDSAAKWSACLCFIHKNTGPGLCSCQPVTVWCAMLVRLLLSPCKAMYAQLQSLAMVCLLTQLALVREAFRMRQWDKQGHSLTVHHKL
jgi:hypothetical protein